MTTRNPTTAEAEVEVAVDPDTAFRIFTTEIDLWWVRGPINHYDASRIVELRLEPGVGGRVLEIYDEAAGDVLARERVTVWEPGARLVLTGDDTEVDVSFEQIDDGTRVRVAQYLLPSGDPERAGFGWVNMLHTYGAWLGRRDTAPREPREVDRLGVAVYYRDPVAAARWLHDAFGLGDWDVDRVPEPDDRLGWIEFHAGNSLIMVFAGDEARHTNWVFVDDLDDHFERAKAKGAKIISPIVTHGSRSYEAEDLEGHRWVFVQARPSMRIGPGPVERLAAAATAGDEAVVRRLRPAVDPQLAGLLLHRFARVDDAAAIRALVSAGVDPGTTDQDGATALHHAAAAGHRDAVEALIGAGADLDLRDHVHGSSPVLWAREFGQTKIIELLLARGARVNAPDAAKLGLTGVVAGFLDEVPAVLDRSIGWPTPLISAASCGQVDTVRLLLEHGADPNALSGSGDTPLQALRWLGDHDRRQAIRKLLIEAGATESPAPDSE